MSDVAKKFRLSNDLECAIIGGILKGVVPREAITPEEVSKYGRAILGATAVDGITPDGARLYAIEVAGLDSDGVGAYLDQVFRISAGADATEILGKVRDKQLLLELVNTAGEMLSEGRLDVGTLGGLLERDSRTTNLGMAAFGHTLEHGFPPPPQGLSLRSLPKLTECSGGLYALWVLAGGTGLGKSALALQIAIDVNGRIPVLLYDYENGQAVIMDRVKAIFEGNLDEARRETANIFYRDSIRYLDEDLAQIKPPALLVVDSIQSLPGSVVHRRTSLDTWMHRFERLAKLGYYVLLISEVSRAYYEAAPSVAAFKETGEIEYKAGLGLQMIEGPSSGQVELHIVKNRHRPHKGFTSLLTRTRDWWWKEIG